MSTSTPIVHYEFGTSGLTNDSSGNEFHLTSSNVTLVTDSERGDVASFNGSTSVMNSISNLPASISGSNPRTMMMWLKKASTGGAYTFCHGSLNNTQLALGHLEPNGFLIRAYGGTSNNVPRHPVGKWFHLAYTYDGTTLLGYIDGVASTPIDIALNTTVSILNVGHGSIWSTSNKLNGLMSDFRVYDVALSAAEISAVLHTFLEVSPLATRTNVVITPSGPVDGYRLTVQRDGTSTEIVTHESATELEHLITSLVPQTSYTLKVYTLAGSEYSLQEEVLFTTLENAAQNYDKSQFGSNGRYDLSTVDTSELSLLNAVMNDVFITGDNLEIKLGTRKSTFSFVRRGETVPTDTSILAPFDSSAGSGQAITMQLSDNSEVPVTYDETSNSVELAGTVIQVGESILIDNKKCTLKDV